MRTFNCLDYTVSIANFENLTKCHRTRGTNKSELMLYYSDGSVSRVIADSKIVDDLFRQLKQA